LVKLPLRQTTGMVASLFKMATLQGAVPDYTTPVPTVVRQAHPKDAAERGQKTLAVRIAYWRVDGP